MTKKFALYARVSTIDKGQDPEVQLMPLRQYCERRGFTVAVEHVDQMSGGTENRPALKRLMDDARRRRIDGVLVARFDRFARSSRTLVLALEEFQNLGVEFISLAENLDTSTPMGKAVFTILAAIAELERSIIKERVVAGLAKAKANGTRLGRPRTGFDVQKAVELKLAGHTWSQIAEVVGASSATLRRMIPGLLKYPEEDGATVPAQ